MGDKVFMSLKFKFFVFLLLSICCFKQEKLWGQHQQNPINRNSLQNKVNSYNNSETEIVSDIFTGPLLAPFATTVPYKHPAIEIIPIVAFSNGNYNNEWKNVKRGHLFFFQTLYAYKMAVLPFLSCEFFSGIIVQRFHKKTTANTEDFTFRIGLQIFENKQNYFLTDLRFIIQETFPTGKYNKLNPNLFGTDASGRGSYQTTVYLAAQKDFKASKKRILSLSSAVGYTYFSKFFIKGYNYLGGDNTTRGKVKNTNGFSGYLSLEVPFFHKFAFAMDVECITILPSSFKGKTSTPVLFKNESRISLTPGIEYIFSKRVGLLLGSWFTVAGKNTRQFSSIYLETIFLF